VRNRGLSKRAKLLTYNKTRIIGGPTDEEDEGIDSPWKNHFTATDRYLHSSVSTFWRRYYYYYYYHHLLHYLCSYTGWFTKHSRSHFFSTITIQNIIFGIFELLCLKTINYFQILAVVVLVVLFWCGELCIYSPPPFIEKIRL